jgi:hypothetical protein
LEEALSPVLATLEADGYEGTYDLRGRTLHLTIAAGSGACEDCLSPKSIMSRIVGNALERAGLPYEIELTYPTDHGGQS